MRLKNIFLALWCIVIVISLELIRYVNFLSHMSYLDTYILILRANKKQRMKNITKYGHNCKHRKHITITFQVVNFYWLIILIILVSSLHAHFEETYSLRGNKLYYYNLNAHVNIFKISKNKTSILENS